MVVGLIVISWLIALTSTLLASVLFGVGWLGAIGLFFGIGTLSIFALAAMVVLHTVWTDCRAHPRPRFDRDPRPTPAAPPTG